MFWLCTGLLFNHSYNVIKSTLACLLFRVRAWKYITGPTEANKHFYELSSMMNVLTCIFFNNAHSGNEPMFLLLL